MWMWALWLFTACGSAVERGALDGASLRLSALPKRVISGQTARQSVCVLKLELAACNTLASKQAQAAKVAFTPCCLATEDQFRQASMPTVPLP